MNRPQPRVSSVSPTIQPTTWSFRALAAAVFLFPLVAYTITLTPGSPFWDPGETIAASCVLGIPHPPGTPLYMLIGRLFAMMPIANAAVRVNWLAALSAALAVLFTFLLSVRLIRYTQGDNRDAADEIVARTGAVCAAAFVAFSNTFWYNAIDGEVYALSSWVQVFILYLTVKWWEGLERKEGDNRLLVAWYLCFLCIGVNLTAFLVTPALVLFVLMVNRKSLFSLRNFVWIAVLAFVGVSVHLYLMIRAHANPPINEGDPRTWSALRAMLMREQYGSRPMWPRVAPLGFQFAMFFRYFFDQFALNARLGQFAPVLPIAVGLFGAAMHWMRHKKTFFLQAVTIFTCSVGLVIYLNFTDHEVRERYYFFTWAYHFFAIWIGMGLAFLIQWAREKWRPLESGAGLGLACAGAIGFSLLPMGHYWYTHDRRGFYVASDYAYNMLASIKPNGIVFTNGDNDTFPLWYLQQGEGFRKDVSVINLSLLNTDWYIRELRDAKVPMTITDAELANVLENGYLLNAQTGQPEMVSHHMVLNIVANNHGVRPAYIAVTVPDHQGLDTRLVSEGLVMRIEPEGFTGGPGVVPTDRGWMDTTSVRHNLYDVFHYRGLFDAQGNFLRHPYKDENARRLTQNYTAAHMELAYEYRRERRFEPALAELQRVSRMYPDFGQVTGLIGLFELEAGDSARAFAYFADQERKQPSADLYYFYGLALGFSGRVDAGVAKLLKAADLDPADPQAYKAAISLLQGAGREQEAAQIMRTLIDRHPEDPDVQAYLRRADSLRGGGQTEPSAPPIH